MRKKTVRHSTQTYFLRVEIDGEMGFCSEERLKWKSERSWIKMNVCNG